MRLLQFEAAQILLVRVKRMSCLKSWGLRLCKRKPTKLVIAAIARKLAVPMLAVWKNGTTFQPTREKLSGDGRINKYGFAEKQSHVAGA